MKKNIPYLGVGIGLRRDHFSSLLKETGPIDWFEIISENYISFGGYPQYILNKILEKFPVICHGVGLNLGGTGELDGHYLELLQQLISKTHSPWFSDHLCLSGGDHGPYHDLLPIPFHPSLVELVTAKISKIQNQFTTPFAIENISQYMNSSLSNLTEWEFINHIIDKTQCHLLLDVNNIFVNSQNFNFDPFEYIEKVNLQAVVQIHMAGHNKRHGILIDTHGSSPLPEVWDLYTYVLKRAKRPISTLVEWDNKIPALDEMFKEVEKAKEIMARIF